MKKKYLIIAMSCTALLSACGGSSKHEASTPSSTPSTTIEVDMLMGRVAIPVQFIDATTGNPVTQKVTLNASDNIANSNVYEDEGLGSSNATTNGFSTIFLKGDVAKKATSENPVKLRLIASSDDYFTTSIDVYYSGTKALEARFNLVSKANPPAGVAVAVQKDTKADSVGKISKAINLTAKTTDTASKNASATFSLPAGTTLKDSAGNPLTGDLKISIGYFSPKTENIGSVFPGGLSPESVKVQENGVWVNRSGYFITAGLMAVDIVDDKGHKAHLLENAKGSMTIQTPAGTLNPETGQAIKDGDTIPVWSHDEKSGIWQLEQTGTFKQNAEGNFDVTYEVNHLSFWNLDWHYSAVCSPILPIRFTKDFTTSPSVNLNIDISGYGLYKTIGLNKSSDLSGLYNTPKDKMVTFTLKDNLGNKIGEGVKPANSCNTVDISVTGNLPVPRNIPAQILITLPDGFTKAQIEKLLNGVKSLTDSQRTAVLKYTHPSDPNYKFKMDQAAYQKLMDVALSRGQVSTLQSLMGVKVKAQGYFYGYDQDFNHYYNQFSNTGAITLNNVPNKDIIFKGQENKTQTWTDWWSGQQQSYTYTQNYAYVYGYVQNSAGNWEYVQIPLKSAATIKKDATQTSIVFEDIDAMQHILSSLYTQGIVPK